MTWGNCLVFLLGVWRMVQCAWARRVYCWCIRPLFLFGPVRLPAMPTRNHDYACKIQHLAVMTDKFNGQPNDPGKRPAIPGKEYLWCQGPSLKEKPKRETHQWGEGRGGRIIPVSRLLEEGRDHWPLPSTPLHPPQPQSPGWPTSWPLDKGRGGGRGEVSPG